MLKASQFGEMEVTALQSVSPKSCYFEHPVPPKEMRSSRRRERIRVFAAVGMTILLSLCAPAMAQQSRIYQEGGGWVEEISGTLPAAATVRVTTDVGAVRIIGGQQPNITYTIRKRVYRFDEESARREFERFHISVTHAGDTANFEGEWEEGRSHRMSADFEIQVPRNLQLAHVETHGGSVDVNSIAGRVEAETGGGHVHLDDIGGSVTAASGGGDIQVGRVGGAISLETGGGHISIASVKGAVNASTGGGDIRLQSSDSTAQLETGGGSISVEHCGGALKASTGGGSIDVSNVNGAAKLETGGGSIHLDGATGEVGAETGGGTIELYKICRGAQAETGGGSMVAEFAVCKGGLSPSRLDTSAGDIVVYLPPNLPVTIRASVEMAGRNGITSEVAGIHITTEGGEYGPRQMWAEGNLNGGGPLLKLHTVNGSIEFRKAPR